MLTSTMLLVHAWFTCGRFQCSEIAVQTSACLDDGTQSGDADATASSNNKCSMTSHVASHHHYSCDILPCPEHHHQSRDTAQPAGVTSPATNITTHSHSDDTHGDHKLTRSAHAKPRVHQQAKVTSCNTSTAAAMTSRNVPAVSALSDNVQSVAATSHNVPAAAATSHNVPTAAATNQNASVAVSSRKPGSILPSTKQSSMQDDSFEVLKQRHLHSLQRDYVVSSDSDSSDYDATVSQPQHQTVTRHPPNDVTTAQQTPVADDYTSDSQAPRGDVHAQTGAGDAPAHDRNPAAFRELKPSQVRGSRNSGERKTRHLKESSKSKSRLGADRSDVKVRATSPQRSKSDTAVATHNTRSEQRGKRVRARDDTASEYVEASDDTARELVRAPDDTSSGRVRARDDVTAVGQSLQSSFDVTSCRVSVDSLTDITDVDTSVVTLSLSPAKRQIAIASRRPNHDGRTAQDKAAVADQASDNVTSSEQAIPRLITNVSLAN